ncbi:MAG: hypothetical protein EAX95_01150 [Candidatus Thorarchaeota archaeon]|nr:hypothetical protein [Candidatus Thorarchaeota archaeon]
MSGLPKTNKFILTVIIITLVLGGMTFTNLPGPATSTSVQVVNGRVFNFADYASLTHEQLAVYNYLWELLAQPLGEWEGWFIRPDLYSLVHYQLAFMTYSIARMFEVTSGYRTNYYSGLLDQIILKMNTSEAEYGLTSIESMEWLRPSIGYANWTQYYYPDAANPNEDDVYTGGYRGPANIMWTAHYALMELLHERSFNTGEYFDEYTWYMQDWNNSLTTDGFNNVKESGIWDCGLIPCQPYEIWTQCNSVPILFTELYDNMYATDFMPIWDYGLNFMEEEMTDNYGLYTDGYFVQEPAGYVHTNLDVQQQFPGPQLDPYIADGRPYVSAYGIAWTMLFLEYTQPEKTVEDYPVFLEVYGREISGDQMYIIDSYNNPSGFGTYDILANLYAVALAQQQDDLTTRDRIMNFLWRPYNKLWSADGHAMHWDTQALEPFLESSLAFGYLWATVPVSVKELAEPRSAEFWDYPFISGADDDDIWVYQAKWDSQHNAFILNLKVDRVASLTFSNFDTLPAAYTGGAPVGIWVSLPGDNYRLTLQPGSYNLVIM